MRYDVTMTADGRTDRREVEAVSSRQAAHLAFCAWGRGVNVFAAFDDRMVSTVRGDIRQHVFHGTLYGRHGYATVTIPAD